MVKQMGIEIIRHRQKMSPVEDGSCRPKPKVISLASSKRKSVSC